MNDVEETFDDLLWWCQHNGAEVVVMELKRLEAENERLEAEAQKWCGHTVALVQSISDDVEYGEFSGENSAAWKNARDALKEEE